MDIQPLMAYPAKIAVLAFCNHTCRAAAKLRQRALFVEGEVELQLRAVDLFSGCGGMSLGFMNAGIDVVEAFDNWDPAINVYRENFDHSITKQDLSDIQSAIELVSNDSPDLICGGPPCQDFSTAGYQDETRGRAALSIAFSEIVASVKPSWFVMENVATIRNTKSFARALDNYRAAGYGLTCKVLNAAYCGVPQARKRMFVVGGLDQSDRFLDKELETNLAAKPMSIRDCLGDSLGIDYYFRVPTNYSRRGVFSIDEPSMTIRAVDRPIPKGYKGNPKDPVPVSEVRCLTPKERSYIQTFPKDFKFFGGKSDMNTMIGNAVPVNLANYVASALLRYIQESGACE